MAVLRFFNKLQKKTSFVSIQSFGVWFGLIKLAKGLPDSSGDKGLRFILDQLLSPRGEKTVDLPNNLIKFLNLPNKVRGASWCRSDRNQLPLMNPMSRKVAGPIVVGGIGLVLPTIHVVVPWLMQLAASVHCTRCGALPSAQSSKSSVSKSIWVVLRTLQDIRLTVLMVFMTL